MRAKSIKFVEKNIVENLSDFGLDKDFSNRTQKKKKSLQYKSLQINWNSTKF